MGEAGVEGEVDEPAGHLLPAIGVHAGVAVGSEGLLPLRGEEDGFRAHGGVAGGAAETGHAADPLAEGGAAVVAAPAAHVVAGGGEAGSAAEAFQDVIIRHVDVELAGLLNLLLEAAIEQANAAVVKALKFSSGGNGGYVIRSLCAADG